MSKKNYYYLDTSVLLEEDFYLLLEEYWKTVSDICFVIDANIYRDIENYLNLGKITEAQVLENTVNLLAALGAALQVDTAGGFDWLLTKRIAGEDATHSLYLSDPRRLAVTSGEILRHLHSLDGSDCPVTDRMITYFATVDENYRLGQYDGSYGSFKDADEAYAVTLSGRGALKSDTLLHGDYCLPNFLLDGWRFSGFIDLGGGGVGDRHVDLFWGAWTLNFNLKTDKYREIFFDAYGRELVDPEKLRIISAAECFG